MKKQTSIALTAVLLFTFINIFAQIEKGTLVAGSNLSINYENTKNKDSKQDYISLGIAPNFGFAVRKNLVLGGILNYGISFTKNIPFQNNQYPYQSVNHNIGSTFFAKQYFIKGKFGGFILAGLNPSYILNQAESNNPNLPQKSIINSYRISLFFSAGLTYFFNENWAIELQYGRLGYAFFHTPRQQTFNNDEKKHSLIAGFTPDNLSINARYYFRPKSKKPNVKEF